MDTAGSGNEPLDGPGTHAGPAAQPAEHECAPVATAPCTTSAGLAPAAATHAGAGESAGPGAGPPVATAHSTTEKSDSACPHQAAAPAPPSEPGGGAALGRGGALRAATTLAGVSAAAAELRLAVRAHFDGLVGEMQRLRALNEALAERCGAQAEQASAAATFAQDVAAVALRADSGDEEDIQRALQGLDATLADIEAELDSLEAQQAQHADQAAHA